LKMLNQNLKGSRNVQDEILYSVSNILAHCFQLWLLWLRTFYICSIRLNEHIYKVQSSGIAYQSSNQFLKWGHSEIFGILYLLSSDCDRNLDLALSHAFRKPDLSFGCNWLIVYTETQTMQLLSFFSTLSFGSEQKKKLFFAKTHEFFCKNFWVFATLIRPNCT
jgi:hypothetical protein